jgi:hypothetical protein
LTQKTPRLWRGSIRDFPRSRTQGAALEATARKPRTPPQCRKDIPAVLRGDEVA